MALTYQWQLNGQNLANNAHYVGATSNILTIVGVAPVDLGPYRVIVSDAGGSTTSGTAGLSVPGCAPAPPGLIAWYKGEGNAQDSADSHHGSLVNNPGFRAGPMGLGFDLGLVRMWPCRRTCWGPGTLRACGQQPTATGSPLTGLLMKLQSTTER